MPDIKEFQSDSRAINDGTWERVDEAKYGDLEIRSRGYTDEFIDAQKARLAKAAEPYSGDQTRIPNSELRAINGSLLEDFLVLDVRNLTKAGEPVPVADFHRMLYDIRFSRLAQASWQAASRVTTRSVAQIEAAAGNSPPPFATISSMVATEAA